MTPQPDLVTVTEAARIVGSTRGAIHHHILTRRLPAVRVGRPYLIPRAAVEQLRRDRAARNGQSETASR